jgi:hypothetical protein
LSRCASPRTTSGLSGIGAIVAVIVEVSVMRTRDPLLSASIVCAMCALSGCASVPQEDIEKRAAEIRIYRTAELAEARYESIGHIWVDSWPTAFFPPTYTSEDEALRSLRAEAARLGANGLVNVVCLDQNVPRKPASEATTVLCYGYAVRVPRSPG